MYKFINNLRKKPRKNRQVFTLSFSLFFTALIFSFWVFIRAPEFSKITSVITENKKGETKAITPVKTLKKGLGDFMEVTSTGLSEIKEQLNSVVKEFSEQNPEVQEQIEEELKINDGNTDIFYEEEQNQSEIGTSSEL